MDTHLDSDHITRFLPGQSLGVDLDDQSDRVHLFDDPAQDPAGSRMLFPGDPSGADLSGGFGLGKTLPTDQGIHPDLQGPERNRLCGWS